MKVTPEIKEEARKLHEEGKTYTDIAKVFNVFPNTVKTWLDPIYAERGREAARRWREDNLERRERGRVNFCQNHPESYLLIRAKNRAKNKGIDFTITIEDIVIPDKCPYLGIPLEINAGKGRSSLPSSPTLDRIDSTKGYIPGNVIVVSHRANSLKGNASFEEIMTMAHNIRQLFDVRPIPEEQ